MINDQKTTVSIDLDKFSKTWYEIARLPHRFEKGLANVSATYTIIGKNKISVLNKGINAKFKHKQIKGIAWVSNYSEPRKLKVQFLWPFLYPIRFIMLLKIIELLLLEDLVIIIYGF